jgi:archaellum biogenesis ATPase FlaH
MTKYDVKVAALNGTIAEIEVDLYSSRKSGDELQALLKDVTEQKERAVQDALAI